MRAPCCKPHATFSARPGERSGSGHGMNPAEFRRMALDLAGAVESAHMGHPDFRVNNRIFATLHAGEQTGMVKLTPEQQHEFVAGHPKVFAPESGAWGRAGCTRVRLDSVREEVLGEALTLAWRNTRQKGGAKRSGRARSAKRNQT